MILYFFIFIIFANIYLIFFLFPTIYFNLNKINSNNLDILNLNKKKIKNLASFRSYIHYTRFKNLNSQLMDKIYLSKYLKDNNLPHSKIYYTSHNNFKIRNIVNKLISNKINFVVKPSNLSEKINCIVFKNGINALNGSKVNLNIFNDFQIKQNISTESLTLKKICPGVIIQESLDIYDSFNEWKVFCCWGHVIFAVWRKNHSYDIGILDSNYEYFPIIPFLGNPTNPPFKIKIFQICQQISKNYPFIRIDVIWNQEKFVINEIEFCPSGFYGYHNEKLLIDAIKKGYNLKSDNYDYLLEIKSYFYFIINRFDSLMN